MRDLAFYYPGPVWQHGNQVKNLVLFFDGVALLVPDYLRDKPFDVDPAIAVGLRDAGLLELLSPETFISGADAKAMEKAVVAIIDAGKLDALPHAERFAEVSMSRLGYYADPRIANRIMAALERRGLARGTEDGLSVPVHPLVRSLILALWSQLLRTPGKRLGWELQPATDRPELIQALEDALGLPTLPSAGHVVSSDLAAVGVDLSAVPLDEVLAFRRQHGPAYKAYARNLRQFVRGVAPLNADDQRDALKDRLDEIGDAATDLREAGRAAWKKPIGFALNIAGAAWNLHSGNLVGAGAGLANIVLGAVLRPRQKADAFSYIFAAGTRYGRH